METIRIEKVPEIAGRYGTRYLVPVGNDIVHNIFNVLNVWGCEAGICTNSKGVQCKVYELPLGHTIEANPLLMYYLDSLNCQIVRLKKF